MAATAAPSRTPRTSEETRMTDIGFPPIWSCLVGRVLPSGLPRPTSCLFDKYLLGERVVRQSSFVNDNTLPRRILRQWPEAALRLISRTAPAAFRGVAASVRSGKH